MISYLLAYNRYLNLVGIAVILAIAVLFSRDRSAINLRLVLKALALQFFIAFIVLKTFLGTKAVAILAYYVGKIYLFADEGIAFVFGNLADTQTPWGFIFAIKVLPVIIFFGALTSLLFHFGIIQRCVTGINYLIRPLLGTSGAETLCAAANSFLGQTESPLLVRNYLKDMTKSELLVVMVSGMATISGSILVVYAAMGIPAPHLLASSVMSIPGAILIAKILIPETHKTKTGHGAHIELKPTTSNAFDAIAAGTSDGLQLSINVAAMLITFLAFLALFNYGTAYLSYLFNFIPYYLNLSWRLPELTIDMIFGYLFAPFGYLLGFTGNELFAAGELLGIKVAVNELVAYRDMIAMHLTERTQDILTYALCGFSNFSCIGIQIGGIGALVPEKRVWLTELGLYAVLGGALTNLLSAMIASLLL